MFNLAEMWGLRPDASNPRKHIKKFPEEKRERFLSVAELKHVGEVLREIEQEGIELPSSIAATRLLILTGCRLGEIMMLRWEHVDIPGKALRLPDSKTGAKVVHLGQPAIDVLDNMKRLEGTPWVIVGAPPGARISDLQPFWQRIRVRAGLKDVRIHDSRHTFASTAVNIRSRPADDWQAARAALFWENGHSGLLRLGSTNEVHAALNFAIAAG